MNSDHESDYCECKGICTCCDSDPPEPKPSKKKDTNQHPSITELNTKINEGLKNRCKHRDRYSYSYGTVYCDRVNGIIEILSKNNFIVLDTNTFSNLFKLGFNNEYAALSDQRYCCFYNNNVLSNFILDQVNKVKSIPDDILDHMFKCNGEFYKYFKSLTEKGIIKVPLTESRLDSLVNKFADTIYRPKIIDYTNYYIDKIGELPLELIKCDTFRDDYDVSYLIINNLDKIEITGEHLCKACKVLPQTEKLVNTILNCNKNLRITETHFDNVIENKNVSFAVMKFLLSKARIDITKERFHKILKAMYSDWRDKSNDDDKNKTLELIFTMGYIPDNEDLKVAASYKLYFPDVERFPNLHFNKELLDICQAKNFYPPYDFDCLSKEMLELQQMCRNRDITKLRNHMKLYNITPDQRCIINACRHKHNKPALVLLKDKGGVFGWDAVIENMRYNSNDTFTFVFECFKDNIQQEIKGYKDEINDLKKQIEELKSVPDADDEASNFSVKSIVDYDKDISECSIDDVKAALGISDDESDTEQEQVPDQEPEQGNTLEINEDDLSKVLLDRETTYSLNKEVNSLFKTKGKVDFDTVKDKLITYIVSNNCIDKKNKQMIVLDAGLTKIYSKLGIPEKIHMENIDKLVYLLIKN